MMGNYIEPEKAIPGRVYQAGSLSDQRLTFPTIDPIAGITAGKAIFLTPGAEVVKDTAIAGDTFMGIAMAPDAAPPNRERCVIVAKGYVWAICGTDIAKGTQLGFDAGGTLSPIASGIFVGASADRDNLLAQADSVTLGSGTKIVLVYVKPITTIQAAA